MPLIYFKQNSIAVLPLELKPHHLVQFRKYQLTEIRKCFLKNKNVQNIMVSCSLYSEGGWPQLDKEVTDTIQCIHHTASLQSVHQQLVCDLRQQNWWFFHMCLSTPSTEFAFHGATHPVAHQQPMWPNCLCSAVTLSRISFQFLQQQQQQQQVIYEKYDIQLLF